MKRVSTLRLPRAIRRAIVDHALRERPLECCGLLLGTPQEIVFAAPMANVAQSPVRYQLDDQAHIAVRRVIRDLVPALMIRGVYHSHPQGDPVPSETDIAEAHYPDWAYVIVGLGGKRPVLRAFSIRSGGARSISLR